MPGARQIGTCNQNQKEIDLWEKAFLHVKASMIWRRWPGPQGVQRVQRVAVSFSAPDGDQPREDEGVCRAWRVCGENCRILYKISEPNHLVLKEAPPALRWGSFFEEA